MALSFALNAKSAEQKHPSLGGRAKLLALNSVLTYGTATVAQLLVTPVILAGLGLELFGAWAVIRQILNYLSLADLRPFTGLKLTLSLTQHDADPEPKRRQLGASLVIWLITLPLMVGLSIGVLAFSDQLVPVAAQDVASVRWALVITLMGSTALTIFALPNNVLRGMNLDYQAIGMQACLNLLFGVACVVALAWGWGLPGLAGAALVTPVASGIVQLLLVRRSVPWFGFARPTREDLQGCVRVNGWLLLDTGMFVLVFSQDLVIAGVLLSLEQAGSMALTMIASRLFFDIAGQLLTSVGPGVAGLWGKGEHARVQALRHDIHLAAIGLLAIGGSGYFLLNKAFLHLWVGHAVPLTQGALLPLLLIGAVQLGYRLEKIWLDVAFDFRARVIANLVACLVTLAVAQSSVEWGGITGLAWALALPRVVLLLWIVRRNGQKLQSKTGQPSPGLVRSLFVTGCMLGLALIMPELSPAGWANFFGAIVAVGACASGFWFLCALPDRNRRRFITRLQGLH